jgi:dienelactone hydrolase
MRILIIITLFFQFAYASCSDLNYDDCIYWSSYCEWNNFENQCQDIDGDDSNNDYGPFQFSSFNESNGLIPSENYLGATVFYPLDGQPPFSSIVIVPGAFSSESTMHQWGEYYASYGFISMTIGINDFFNDDMSDLAYSLLDAIEVLKQENNRLDSPILNQVNTNSFATSGWSIGGGAAQYAATIDSSLRAVIALNPGLAIQDYENCNDPTYDYYCLVPDHLNHNSPVLIISSEGDIENPTDIDAAVHYNYTPESTTKMLFELEGGNHGTGLSPYSGSGELGEKVIDWLNYHLLENLDNCDTLLNIPSSATQFYTNLQCQEFLAGDINGDYIINVQDIVLTVNLVMTEEYNSAADLNSDDVINVLDVVQIVNIILN